MGDKDDTFSYEQLFDVVRRERAREELQELQANFYQQAKTYCDDMENEIRSRDPLDTQSDQIRTQLVNSKKLLRELYDRREKKIVFLALNKARTGSNMIDTSAVIESEKPLYESILHSLKRQRDDISLAPPPRIKTRTPTPKETLDKTTDKKSESSEPEVQSGHVKVKVTASVPKFLGANGQTHGPYEQGAEVALPERIARILIRKGRAEHA